MLACFCHGIECLLVRCDSDEDVLSVDISRQPGSTRHCHCVKVDTDISHRINYIHCTEMMNDQKCRKVEGTLVCNCCSLLKVCS